VNAADFEAQLRTARYGKPLELLEVTTSTNDDARARAEAGARDGHLVVAREQSAGRGSQGRSWSSPTGGLYFSLVLRPRLETPALPPLTLVVGRALAESIEARCPDLGPAEVKWPNDVLVDGRKCAGILVESATVGAKLEHVVVGVGINVGRDIWDAELQETATSLPETDHGALLADVLLRLEEGVALLEREGPASAVRAIEDRLAYRDETVRCGDVTGTLLGLSPSGALRIDTAKGIREVVAGRLEVTDPQKR